MAIPPLDERSRGLLRLATTDDVDDREWLAWSAAYRLDDLSAAEVMLLAPIAFRRSRPTGPAGDARLAGVARRWWSHNSTLWTLVATAQARLRGAGINPVLTGPAAVGFFYAGNLARRPVPRAEIAVDAPDVARALGILARESWDAGRCAISGPGELRDGGELRNPPGERLLLRWRIPFSAPPLPVELNGEPSLVPAAKDVLSDLLSRPDSWSPASPLLWEVDLAMILRALPAPASPAAGTRADRIDEHVRERIIRLRDLSTGDSLRAGLSALAALDSRRRPARAPAPRDWPAVAAYLRTRWHSRGPVDFLRQLARKGLGRVKIR